MDKQIQKLALVTSWFGKNLKGGAEQQAWQMATRLKKAGFDITILTTCSQSFHHSWDQNFYKPGIYQEDHITIKRFAVGPRNAKEFNRVVSSLLSLSREELKPGISPLSLHDENIYLHHNIQSPDLLNYLRSSLNTYDAFLFLPYLFPLALKGIEITKKKSILQPCLHDECYAYLNVVKEMFEQCGLIFFNSNGEKDVAEKLYGTSLHERSLVVGEGVEINTETLTHVEEPLVTGKYLLYLGKRCEEKNTPFLIKAFDAFSKTHNSSLKLVIAGQGQLPFIPKSDQVLDVGTVSEDNKWNLLKYCSLLINPSENESFSRVIYEAWSAEKPVIIHKGSQATHRALKDSENAGWAFETEEELVQILSYVSDIAIPELDSLGKKGSAYSKKIADWDGVIERYRTGFKEMSKNQ